MDDLARLMQALPANLRNKLIPRTTSTHQSQDKHANSNGSREKASNIDNLARLVQALPAELYNKIFELVCPFPDAGSQNIDGTYKPPRCLLISRVMRKMHTPNYYGNSIFYIKKAYFRSWVNSLTTDHIGYLKDVRIVDAFITPGLGGFPSADSAFAALTFPKWLRDSHSLEIEGIYKRFSLRVVRFKILNSEEVVLGWESFAENLVRRRALGAR